MATGKSLTRVSSHLKMLIATHVRRSRSIRQAKITDFSPVEIFVDWVYTQKVPSKASSWSKDLPFRAALRYKAVEMALLKARVFADRFLASEFGHVVEYTYIQWMIDSGSRWYEAVAYAYQNLPAESLVLTAMINTHVHHFRSWTDNEDNEDIHHRDKLPQSFLVGVMLRYAWLIENKAARKKLVPCDYHIHDSLGDKDKCQAAVDSLQDDISGIDEGEEVKEE